MAGDKREDILDRVYTVLGTLGASTVTRNRGELDPRVHSFPALMLLDGDEQTATLFETMREVTSTGRRPARPELVKLTPEIYIELLPVTPHNETVGQQLNEWRAKVVSALLTDSQLVSIVTDNGSIAYLGCNTDLGRSRALNGMMRVNMAFMYPLHAQALGSAY